MSDNWDQEEDTEEEGGVPGGATDQSEGEEDGFHLDGEMDEMEGMHEVDKEEEE